MPNIGLTELAASIVDGLPVDWKRLQSAQDVSPALLANGRVVERLAQLHRSLPPIDTFNGPFQDSLQLLDARFTEAFLDQPPVSWGPLILLDKIGSGTYGDVFRARDTRLNRIVALKLLCRRDRREEAIVEEGHLLARVRHPNVATVYGAERIDGRVGVWMEFVDGITLAQEMELRGPLSPSALKTVARDLASALEGVHAAGVVHRDVKAQNVMRENTGRLVLMDFGAGSELADLQHGTAAQLAGTPIYLAPEVLRGEAATPASDLYSLGVLLFYLATGSFPARGRSLAELREAHEQASRPSVRELRIDLPVHLASVIDRALAPSPSERFAMASEIVEALGEQDRRWTTKVRAGILSAIAAVALAGVVIRVTTQQAPQREAQPQRPDTVLVTAFESRPGDADCQAIARKALKAGMFESRKFVEPSESRVREGLQMMKRPVEEPLDREVARELAIRDGHIKGIVTGAAERERDHCRITFRLIDPADDTTVAILTSDIEAAPQSASAHARDMALQSTFAIGLTHLKAADTVLQPATTRSLNVLRLYSRSYELGRQGNWAEAGRVITDAVTEDPEFASGWIWLAWATRNNLPRDEVRVAPLTVTERWFEEQRPRYLAYAQKAVALSDDLPEWEKDWISGSLYSLSDDDASAVPFYERLLALKPGHEYGANNLLSAYRALGRSTDYVRLSRERADANPNDASETLNYIERAAAFNGELAGLQPYMTRLKSLLQAETQPGLRDASEVNLDWMPVYATWMAGDIGAVLKRVNEAESDLAAQSPTMRGRSRAVMAYFNLALGRLSEAEKLMVGFDHPSGEMGHSMDEAFMTVVRNEPDRTRQLVINWPRRGPVARPYTLLFAGLWDETEAMLREQQPLTSDQKALFALGRGELLLEQGHSEEALPELRRGVSGLRRTPFFEYYAGCELEAAALETLGRQQEADDALRICANERPPWYPFFATPSFWMKLKLHLADNLRLEGKIPAALQIENELRQRLTYADADHPLLRRLAQR